MFQMTYLVLNNVIDIAFSRNSAQSASYVTKGVFASSISQHLSLKVFLHH